MNIMFSDKNSPDNLSAEKDSVSTDLALNLDAPSNTTNARVNTAIVSIALFDMLNNA